VVVVVDLYVPGQKYQLAVVVWVEVEVEVLSRFHRVGGELPELLCEEGVVVFLAVFFAPVQPVLKLFFEQGRVGLLDFPDGRLVVKEEVVHSLVPALDIPEVDPADVLLELLGLVDVLLRELDYAVDDVLILRVHQHENVFQVFHPEYVVVLLVAVLDDLDDLQYQGFGALPADG
jgi:hypothetical protein